MALNDAQKYFANFVHQNEQAWQELRERTTSNIELRAWIVNWAQKIRAKVAQSYANEEAAKQSPQGVIAELTMAALCRMMEEQIVLDKEREDEEKNEPDSGRERG